METIIAAIVGLFGGSAFGAFLAGWFARKKVKAEVNRESSDAWKEFAENMERKQREYEAENKEIRLIQKAQDRKMERWGKRIIYLTKGIETLVNQIIANGEKPIWNPDEWDPEKDN